jgi:hypothetical protein
MTGVLPLWEGLTLRAHLVDDAITVSATPHSLAPALIEWDEPVLEPVSPTAYRLVDAPAPGRGPAKLISWADLLAQGALTVSS